MDDMSTDEPLCNCARTRVGRHYHLATCPDPTTNAELAERMSTDEQGPHRVFTEPEGQPENCFCSIGKDHREVVQP